LKKICISCQKPLDNNWTHCPSCGKDQEEKVTKILEKTEKNDKKTSKKELKK
jgi:predicted amidophosphoribosyltransferase